MAAASEDRMSYDSSLHVWIFPKREDQRLLRSSPAHTANIMRAKNIDPVPSHQNSGLPELSTTPGHVAKEGRERVSIVQHLKIIIA